MAAARVRDRLSNSICCIRWSFVVVGRRVGCVVMVLNVNLYMVVMSFVWCYVI